MLCILKIVLLFSLLNSSTISGELKRIIYFEVQYIKNVEKKTIDGRCCSKFETGRSFGCSDCSHTLQIILNDGSYGKSIYSYQAYAQITDEKFGIPILQYEVDNIQQKYITIHHLVTNTHKTLDYFGQIKVVNIGEILFKDVFGLHYNSKLKAVLELYSLNPFDIQRTLLLTINNIEFIRNRFFDGTCCGKGSHQCIACDYRLKIDINDEPLMDYMYQLNLYPPHFLNSTESFYEDAIFKKNNIIIINIINYRGTKLIDQIILEYNSQEPNKYYNYLVVGQYGNIKLNYITKYECQSFTGSNCHIPCKGLNFDTYCNYETGKKYCLNDAGDTSKCIDEEEKNICDDNPCENGGICIPNPFGYTCKCPIEYSGMHCESQQISNTYCVMGRLNNHLCICEKGYFGYLCDRKFCSSVDGEVCTNSKICIQFWYSDEIYCLTDDEKFQRMDVIVYCKRNCEQSELRKYVKNESLSSLCLCIPGRDNANFIKKYLDKGSYCIGLITMIFAIYFLFFLLKWQILQKFRPCNITEKYKRKYMSNYELKRNTVSELYEGNIPEPSRNPANIVRNIGWSQSEIELAKFNSDYNYEYYEAPNIKQISKLSLNAIGNENILHFDRDSISPAIKVSADKEGSNDIGEGNSVPIEYEYEIPNQKYIKK